MVKIKEHKIETFKIPVSVCMKDIEESDRAVVPEWHPRNR